MRLCAVIAAALCLLLTGCASTAREPDDLALVRVLGVDGAGPVTLVGVCGAEDKGAARGSSCGCDFGQARRALPWSGPGEELSLTGVSYLLVGPEANPDSLLLHALEDVELGASATVWFAPEGAAALLSGCEDPAADLALLALAGTPSPTIARAAAALAAGEEVLLPMLSVENGRLEVRGAVSWSGKN